MTFTFSKILAALSILSLIACGDAPGGNSGNSGNGGSDNSSSSNGGGGSSKSYLVLPSGADAGKANSLYDQWKGIYYRIAQGDLDEGAISTNDLLVDNYQDMARIRFDQGDGCEPEGVCTVSEGIGYAMLITYFQDDRDAFEKLWRYSRAHSGQNGVYNSSNLMDWKMYSFRYGAIGKSSATDADLDIATALYLGYKKWNDNEMLSDAKLIAGDIWKYEIDTDNMLIIPGNQSWKGTDEYNPSYFSPIALRIFAEIDNEHDWNGVLNASYAWLENISANGNLVMDWADAAGAPKKPHAGASGITYRQFYLESVRVPWRMAWDFAWFGEERAKTILNRMAEFVINDCGGDPSRIRQKYNYTGTSVDATFDISKTMAQKASLCATGTADENRGDWLSACSAIVNDTPISGFNYFHHILQVMYGQLLNGKYGAKPF